MAEPITKSIPAYSQPLSLSHAKMDEHLVDPPCIQYTSDIVIGLQYGDEGKGKIVHALAKNPGAYEYCVRFNGGANAGHTIYHAGKKIVTHQVPSGILFGIPCIIGDNCYVDIAKLLDELKMLHDHGIKTDEGMLYISPRCNIITVEHLTEDGKDTAIGTTKSGIGPCATAKYGRRGTRIDICQDVTLYKILLDAGIEIQEPNRIFMEYFKKNNRYPRLLVEGAQAYGLDITYGDYPYVTSSHCLATDCLNMAGINMHPTDCFGNIYTTRIWGVAKAYETYVGAKEFQPGDDPILVKIQQVGQEFGSTTGRKRQCNYLNLDRLYESGFVNQITHLVINKCDVLTHPEVNTFKFADRDYAHLTTLDDFTSIIRESVTGGMGRLPGLKKIYFEHSADSATEFV